MKHLNPKDQTAAGEQIEAEPPDVDMSQNPHWPSRRSHRVEITLPPDFSRRQAFLLVNVFSQLADKLWDLCGDALYTERDSQNSGEPNEYPLDNTYWPF